MIEGDDIELIQLLGKAGRHLARDRFLEGNPADKSVTGLAGTDGNGGGALVCVRRQHNYGADVPVYVTALDSEFAPVPTHRLDILRRMDAPVVDITTGMVMGFDGA